MFKKLLPWYLLGLVVLSLAFIYGCGSAPTSGGGGGTTSHGTISYAGTQSPGDAWSWIISSESFLGTCESGTLEGFWVTGTWETLSASGFGKGYVSDSAGNVANGSSFYFLEYPNTMLIVKPQDGRVIICAASAVDEPAEGRYIFVNIPKKNWVESSPSLGTVEVVNSGGTWTFTVSNYQLTGEPLPADPPHTGFTYSNGVFSSGSEDLKVFMTPSGLFMGDNGTDYGGFAGASYEANITTSELDNTILPHTYKGVRFVYNPSTGTGETEPMTVSKAAASSTMLGSSYENLETGSTYSGGVIITFEAQQPTGFIKGDIEDIGISDFQTIECVVSKVGPASNRKYLLFGIGKEGTGRTFNFLMIQTD